MTDKEHEILFEILYMFMIYVLLIIRFFNLMFYYKIYNK